MRTLILSLTVIALGTTVYTQSDTFERGASVRVQPTTGSSEPKTTTKLLLRVVAIPNDRIRIDERQSAIYVNDVEVVGFSSEFVARLARAPRGVPQVVPEGHYFVMGEQRSTRTSASIGVNIPARG